MNSTAVSTVTQSAFARFIGYSGQQVARWIKEGMPAERVGKQRVSVKIDSAVAIRWLLDRKKPEESANGLEHERRRENDLADRLLLPLSETQEVLNESAAVYRARVDQLRSRLPPLLAGLQAHAELQRIIGAETDLILEDVAARFAGLAATGPAIADRPAEGKAAPGPVGRRKPRVPRRKPRARKASK